MDIDMDSDGRGLSAPSRRKFVTALLRAGFSEGPVPGMRAAGGGGVVCRLYRRGDLVVDAVWRDLDGDCPVHARLYLLDRKGRPAPADPGAFVTEMRENGGGRADDEYTKQNEEGQSAGYKGSEAPAAGRT